MAVKRKVPVRPANGMYRHLRMYARLFRQRKKIFRVRSSTPKRRVVGKLFTGKDRGREGKNGWYGAQAFCHGGMGGLRERSTITGADAGDAAAPRCQLWEVLKGG